MAAQPIIGKRAHHHRAHAGDHRGDEIDVAVEQRERYHRQRKQDQRQRRAEGEAIKRRGREIAQALPSASAMSATVMRRTTESTLLESSAHPSQFDFGYWRRPLLAAR
jgi:hypothetical protein